MPLKAALRPPLATALWPLVRPFRRTIERARDGAPLRPGITAVVAARDEEYTIGLALRSLIGLADQIVCVDNGSEDATVREMKAFREEHGDEVEVDIAEMPGALLGDCREEGLRLTRREWHIRWDADMVAQTSGPHASLQLRERVLSDDRPRSIQIPRTNLIGDLRHTGRFAEVVDAGEPWVMRFGRGISYKEYGRFDAVRIPPYYAAKAEPDHRIFHLAGLKSDENLLHRFHYFNWREAVNREGDALDPELRTLEAFKRRKNEALFGTNEPCSLKYRFRRQLAHHFIPYDPARYGDYPEVLKEALAGPQRFEVVYCNGRPWTRVDHEDVEMRDYEPTSEDLAWDPEAFFERLLKA